MFYSLTDKDPNIYDIYLDRLTSSKTILKKKIKNMPFKKSHKNTLNKIALF